MCMHITYSAIHTYRKLAEEELEVAKAKMSTSTIKGVTQAELDILQQGLDQANQNLAEIKLLDAIAQNAPAAEIDLKNQSFISIMAAIQNRFPVSGNNCSWWVSRAS